MVAALELKRNKLPVEVSDKSSLSAIALRSKSNKSPLLFAPSGGKA